MLQKEGKYYAFLYFPLNQVAEGEGALCLRHNLQAVYETLFGYRGDKTMLVLSCGAVRASKVILSCPSGAPIRKGSEVQLSLFSFCV